MDLGFKKIFFEGFAITVVIVVLGVTIFCAIEAVLGGGYYCEYCHIGQDTPNKNQVINELKNIPCQFNKIDSCHHVTFYFSKPESKARIKHTYIR